MTYSHSLLILLQHASFCHSRGEETMGEGQVQTDKQPLAEYWRQTMSTKTLFPTLCKTYTWPRSHELRGNVWFAKSILVQKGIHFLCGKVLSIMYDLCHKQSGQRANDASSGTPTSKSVIWSYNIRVTMAHLLQMKPSLRWDIKEQINEVLWADRTVLGRSTPHCVNVYENDKKNKV